MDRRSHVSVFTDGSCDGNPGPGGYAAILKCGRFHREIVGRVPYSTNNQMELKAVIEGLSNVEAHADGFNAVIGSSESSFSGGEIQRMMIARALIRKPSILILDEATSALDTVVEEQIMKNIRAMNITLIVVAHRLSPIRDCDEIIVLRKGEIIQRGSHAELVAQEGVYKDLMTLEEDNE